LVAAARWGEVQGSARGRLKGGTGDLGMRAMERAAEITAETARRDGEGGDDRWDWAAARQGRERRTCSVGAEADRQGRTVSTRERASGRERQRLACRPGLVGQRRARGGWCCGWEQVERGESG
jgi:hypothetical protein